MTAPVLALPSTWSLIVERGRLEVLQFFRERDMFIFVFLFPIVFMSLFAVIFGSQTFDDGTPVKQYFLPAMLAAGVINTGFQSLGISIAVERDHEILKRLRGTPLPPLAYFGGKIIMVMVASVIQVGALLLLAKFAFGLAMPATAQAWLTFAWVLALGTACCAVLGIAISSVPKSARSASAVVTPIVLVLQFISGVYFLFSELPDWLQGLAGNFPLKWIAQGLRSVFLPDSYGDLEPAGTWEHGRTVLVLVAWLVAGILISVKTFRWQRAQGR